MALRPIHNRIAKIVTGYDDKLIDNVNKEVDAPSQDYPGMPHRQFFHSYDPLRKDSVLIHKGDPRRLILNHIHIIVDEDPMFKRYAKILQLKADMDKVFKNGKTR